MTRYPDSTRAWGATVAITSGTGGVGKTSLTVNLATSLARLGYRVGILDADRGLGNVDVMLGLTPERPVDALLAGEPSIEAVTLTSPDGVQVIPAVSGIRAHTALGAEQWEPLRHVVATARRNLDVLLVDTSPGIHDSVLDLVRLADHVMVVTSSEPTAIVAGYAMIKLVHAASPDAPLGLVVNATCDAAEGQLVFRQLSLAAGRFLGRTIRYYGSVARDARMREAVLRQRALVSCHPDSAASRCYRRLALRVANLSPMGPVVDTALTVPPDAVTPFTDRELLELEARRCA